MCPSKTDLSGSYVTRTSGPAFLCCNYRIKVTKLLSNYNYNHDHVALYPLIFVLSNCGVVGVKGLFSFTPQVKNDRSDYFSFATIFHNPHDTHTPYMDVCLSCLCLESRLDSGFLS